MAYKYKHRKAEYMKEYRAANKDRIKNNYLKWSHGITLSDYNSIFTAQSSACAICLSEKSSVRGFHVDHCHETGKIRGVLCHNCNTALGAFKDSVEVIKKAISYLEKHRGAS